MSLTGEQVAFLYRKGYANTLKKLLERVQTKRVRPTIGNRQGEALRNFRRYTAEYQSVLNKSNNHFKRKQNAARRLTRNHPGLPQHTTYNDLRNAILALPTVNNRGNRVAKTNNMKLFLKLHANMPNEVQRVNVARRRFMNSAQRLIRLSSNQNHINRLNELINNPNQNLHIARLANQVVRNLELQKGRFIRNTVRARMSNPRTAIGRRLALSRMSPN